MSARPFIDKIVTTVPLYVYYKPHGIPLEKLKEETLNLEEIEALNLKDSHLKSARKKIINSIIEGKAIKFEGGNYIKGKEIKRTKCLKGIYHYRIRSNDIGEKEQKYKISKIRCPECGKRLIDFI